MARKLSAIA